MQLALGGDRAKARRAIQNRPGHPARATGRRAVARGPGRCWTKSWPGLWPRGDGGSNPAAGKEAHNLPADTTPFMGRESELAAIGRLLTHDRQRLVTIVGPGGMGKTRLALAVGAALLEQFDDGVYLIDLASVERAEDVPPQARR